MVVLRVNVPARIGKESTAIAAPGFGDVTFGNVELVEAVSASKIGKLLRRVRRSHGICGRITAAPMRDSRHPPGG